MSKYSTNKNVLPKVKHQAQIIDWIDGKFIRGPLPMDWFSKAKSLGGSCVSVGICLWHFKGMARGPVFHAGLSQLCLAQESTDSVRRALKLLESYSLIEIIRKPGCKHRFRINRIKKSKQTHKENT
ncbi:MAG: hypothetical protein HQL32_01650 [Planctomycetes bacterium]|nr:hypothetical protein [Planctomycetota bacterium]